MQDIIAKIIKDFCNDDLLSDWYGMTLRQIFEAMEMPGVIIFWDCWSDVELNTVFGTV